MADASAIKTHKSKLSVECCRCCCVAEKTVRNVACKNVMCAHTEACIYVCVTYVYSVGNNEGDAPPVQTYF